MRKNQKNTNVVYLHDATVGIDRITARARLALSKINADRKVVESKEFGFELNEVCVQLGQGIDALQAELDALRSAIRDGMISQKMRRIEGYESAGFLLARGTGKVTVLDEKAVPSQFKKMVVDTKNAYQEMSSGQQIAGLAFTPGEPMLRLSNKKK